VNVPGRRNSAVILPAGTWCFCDASKRRYSGIMAMRSSGAPPPEFKAPFRLVVKARSSSGRKAFMWEIVRGNGQETSIQQSSESFKTMAEAYDHGSVALGLLLKFGR
jgi:hypothetical protein